MPERNPSVSPTNLVGSVLMSGTPNTGQVLMTQGGQKTFSKNSGTAGGAAVIWTGAGRLDWVQFHPSAIIALSGIAQTLFDAATAASGAEGAANTVLFKTTPQASLDGIAGAISLASGTAYPGSKPMNVGAVFTSGLCHSSASGNPGFSCGYTPVVSG